MNILLNVLFEIIYKFTNNDTFLNIENKFTRRYKRFLKFQNSI